MFLENKPESTFCALQPRSNSPKRSNQPNSRYQRVLQHWPLFVSAHTHGRLYTARSSPHVAPICSLNTLTSNTAATTDSLQTTTAATTIFLLLQANPPSSSLILLPHPHNNKNGSSCSILHSGCWCHQQAQHSRRCVLLGLLLPHLTVCCSRPHTHTHQQLPNPISALTPSESPPAASLPAHIIFPPSLPRRLPPCSWCPPFLPPRLPAGAGHCCPSTPRHPSNNNNR